MIGPGENVRIRRDSKWNVPEPELTLLISADGKITGYTCGNDMSSRDIEGENPLYLPQAKVYDGSCAIGPCILVSETPPGAGHVDRDPHRAWLLPKRSRERRPCRRSSASCRRWSKFLYRENGFPFGCMLMTGTGVIPPDAFTLAHGDEVEITIEGIGTLRNVVAP